MMPISLKFGGQVFHGVQTDSSKFGVICLKISQERVFLIFNWEYTVKLLLFIPYIKNQYILLSDVIILNDVTMQFSLRGHKPSL